MSTNYINWIVSPNDKEIELKEKDLKLLEVMTHNSRASLQEIGRKLNLSKVAVFNRIKNLEEKGVIIGYSCFINFSKLGFSIYNLGLKINSTIEQKNDFIFKIKNLGFVNSVLQLSGGKWNFLIRIISNENLLENNISQILGLTSKNFEFEVLQVSEGTFAKLPDKEKIKISRGRKTLTRFEIKLLYELAKNSRQKMVNLAAKLNTTPKRIISSIKKLKKEEILLSLFTEVNPFTYGQECYVLVITTNNRKVSEKIATNLSSINSTGAFMHFQNPNIISFHIVSSLEDLKKIEKSLKENINDIRDYEFIRVEAQIQYNLFPKKIYDLLMGEKSS